MNKFKVERRGQQWAAISPDGEDLATFTSQGEAQQYAATYAEVFNILAAHTGQAIRIGTGKGESSKQKQQRIKQQADDAARQFLRAGKNAGNPQFATPADAPVGASTASGNRLAAAAAAPAPQLAGTEMPEGLSEADVRRIVQQEQGRRGNNAGRRSVAAAANVAPPVQPATGGRRRAARKQRTRKRRSQTARYQPPATVGGGFVLEDPSVSLTAFDISQQLAGQTGVGQSATASTVNYPAAAMTATAPTSPMADAANATPPAGVPAMVGLPSNAPAAAVRPKGGGSPGRRPKKPGKATLTAADRPAEGGQKQTNAPVAVEVKNTRELAKTIDWAALNALGREGLEKARDNTRWVEGLRRLVEQRGAARDEEKRKKKERAATEERHQTRTSHRLLEHSHRDLAKIFKPFGNALENVRNTTQALRGQAYASVAKKLGIDRLGKFLERESRGFAANAARGGSRRAFSMAARRFGQGAVGQAGARLGGRAVAGIGARAAAGAAVGGAEAAEGGAIVGAGALTALGPVGLAIGAVTLVAVGMAAAAKATINFVRNLESAGHEMLESQRDMARLNAGVAMSFAQYDYERYRRDVQRAAQTSASLNFMSRGQNALESRLQPFHVMGQDLSNLLGGAVRFGMVQALDSFGIGGISFSQWGMIGSKLLGWLSIQVGGQPGAQGHPALKFLDEVVKGKFRSPPPKNKAPKKPGQP